MAALGPPSRERVRRHAEAPERQPGALAIFALIVSGGPLLFGAVDRLSQIVLTFLLALGLFTAPPVSMRLGRWGNRLLLALVSILVLAQFAPAAWFGATLWRTDVLQNFALELPWTHHPEPARALDGLLAAGLALLWFSWVRQLAAERSRRTQLAWILFLSVAAVAAVSFATRGIDPRAIYGLRYTTNWFGFGPFPNRNHTASYLAMGAVLGCGYITWSASRKHWRSVTLGSLALGVILAALLTTESRGGLIACALGLACFLTFALAKSRNRQTLGIALAAALVLGAGALTFGTKVFARFGSVEAGEVSNVTRVRVWQDTFGMWKDAPLFGHGLGSFAQIFPLYQKIDLENVRVSHPESSWLQWLAELGAVPVLLGILGFVLFLSGQLRDIFTRKHSFFLCAAGIGAVVVLLVHSLFDVPAHRWGTMLVGLAALAIACPIRAEDALPASSRRAALIPVVVGAFWSLPFVCDAPAWSPVELKRLLARDVTTATVTLAELENAVRYFPLEPQLHQAIGTRELQEFGRTASTRWQRHFEIASHLLPGSWSWPATQARLCQGVSPGLALRFWQLAVKRGGTHRDDVLRMAVEESRSWPPARSAWSQYVEAHPALMLVYAQLIPEDEARYFFELWLKARGSANDLTKDELDAFYRFVPRFGNAAQFGDWIDRHPELRPGHFRQWANILHGWGEDERAWELLAGFTSDPPFPTTVARGNREQFEARWKLAPQNAVNAQQLATARFQAGETFGSEEIILAVAADPTAPAWFLQKAAHVYARHGKYGEAVNALLGKN